MLMEQLTYICYRGQGQQLVPINKKFSSKRAYIVVSRNTTDVTATSHQKALEKKVLVQSEPR